MTATIKPNHSKSKYHSKLCVTFDKDQARCVLTHYGGKLCAFQNGVCRSPSFRSALRDTCRHNVSARLAPCPRCNTSWHGLDPLPAGVPHQGPQLIPFSAAGFVDTEVVISHCRHDLRLLLSQLLRLPLLVRITVYSKCGVAVPELEKSPNCHLVRLPNVGRCDHTYAWHLATSRHRLASVVLFVKDTYQNVLHQKATWVALDVLVSRASQSGFACGQVPFPQMSIWHDPKVLLKLSLGSYFHR